MYLTPSVILTTFKNKLSYQNFCVGAYEQKSGPYALQLVFLLRVL